MKNREVAMTEPRGYKVACHHCILPVHNKSLVVGLSSSKNMGCPLHILALVHVLGLVRKFDTLLSPSSFYCTRYLEYRWVHVLMGS